MTHPTMPCSVGIRPPAAMPRNAAAGCSAPAAARWLIAATAAMAALPAHAQSSSVTVYGIVDLGMETSRSGNGSKHRLVSGGAAGSRLGFRGVEDLGGGLSAQFVLEQGINADDGTLAQGGRAFGRESSVGLTSSSYGSISMGRIPMPYFSALNGVDAFSWIGNGGMLALNQNGAAPRQVLPLGTSARADNAVRYMSPVLGGFQFRALGAFSEDSATLGRLYSLSVRYSKGPLDVTAAWARQNGATDSSGRVTAFTAGGSYDFGPARLFAGITNEKNSCTTCTGLLTRSAGITGSRASEFRLANLGVQVPFGATTVFAQVTQVADRSQYAVSPGKRDATWLGIGARYELSKRTALYATVATIGNRNGSNYALGTGAVQQPANAVGANNPRATAMAFGVRHSF